MGGRRAREGADYTVTLDEETLPEGVVVAEGEHPEREEPSSGQADRVGELLHRRGRTRKVTSFFDQFVQRIINGLSFGLMLALAAIGLSLVFGTTGISNFAHAEIVTFGAIMVLTLSACDLALPLWSRSPWRCRPQRRARLGLDVGHLETAATQGVGLVQLMIVSIGLSLALRYIFQFFIGGGTRQLPGADAVRDPLFGPSR